MTREEITKSEEIIVPEVVSGPVGMFGFAGDSNVESLTLRQLEQSIRVEGKHGRVLQTRPTQSWNAIAYIIGLLVQSNVNYVLDPVYVQKRNSFPMLNDEEKKLGYNRENCPINRWMFDKVVTSIMIPNVGNDLQHARIGFGFDDDGIQIAFGMNVKVCTNFAILGGQIMRTFKFGGMEANSWESIEYRLMKWVESLDQMFAVEMNLMSRMQEKEIKERAVVLRAIGGLYYKAINQAYGTKAIAPFDTAGMSNFVQNVIKSGDPLKEHTFNAEHGIRNVWDLYNYGTAILQPGIVDISQIQNGSAMFADYLFEEFNISKN